MADTPLTELSPEVLMQQQARAILQHRRLEEEEARKLLKERRVEGAYDGPINVTPPNLSFTSFAEQTSDWKIESWQKILCDRLELMLNQKGQRLLVHGPPQFGKPLDIMSMVLMGDGSYRKLGDIVIGDMVISHTGQPRKVTAVHEQGYLECVEIVTNNGRRTIAALDHPFLTPEGWIEAGALQPEQALANVPEASCGGYSGRTDADFEFLGYFVGDGACGPRSGTSINSMITSNDPVQAERFLAISRELGFACRIHQKQKTTALSYSFSGGVREWLRENGIAGLKSGFKVVPDWVFKGTQQQIALFLGAYFSCDGTVSPKGPDRYGKMRPDATCEFYSVSEPLLIGVQRLLLRVGVQARLSVKTGKYLGTKHTSYRLTFTTQDNVAQFYTHVPIAGKKGDILRGLHPLRRSFASTFLSDPVVSVTPVGNKKCRCLTVETDHTFTVDDLVVRNSWLLSQRFPSYAFGCQPTIRLRLACYNVSHAERFSRTNLGIMRSAKYMELFPNADARIPTICPVNEWYTKGRSDALDANPSFMAIGLGSGLLGVGADCILIDDPYKDAIEARSEATNAHIWDWFEGVVLSRASPSTNIVVLFHRWWEGDFAGKLIDQGGWEMLRFPALADGEPGDPTNREIGESLSPKRYPKEFLQKIALERAPLFYSQYQGTPQAATGNLFHTNCVGMVDVVPGPVAMRVRCWDIASSTEKGSAYTAGVLMARVGAKFYVEDVVRGQWSADVRDAIIKATAQADLQRGPVLHVFPQDPGAAGKDMAASYIRLMQGYSVQTEIETGDKVLRADPFVSQWNASTSSGLYHVALVKGPWNAAFLHEAYMFPKGKVKDQIDAVSRCFSRLAGLTSATCSAGTVKERTSGYMPFG